MQMKSNKQFRGKTVKCADFPYLGHEQETILDGWEGIFSPYKGHGIIAKVLTLAGYSDFDPKKYTVIDEFAFIIYTKDGREIKIEISWSTVDDPSTVTITDGNTEEQYNVISVSGTDVLMVEPVKTVDKTTGFTQYYHKRYDGFTKTQDNMKIHACIGRDDKKDTEEFYFIDESIKQEFQDTYFNNLLEVYTFLTQRLNVKGRFIDMSSYTVKGFSLLERIEITNGIVKDLELMKSIVGRRLKFESEDDSEVTLLNGLIEEAESQGMQLKFRLTNKKQD